MGVGCRCFTYQPAALDRAADSIKGVSTHGFGSSACSVPAILMCEFELTLNDSMRREEGDERDINGMRR